MEATTDLARHTTVVELVATYRAACADVVRAFELLHGAEGRLRATFNLGDQGGWMRVCVGHKAHQHPDWSDPSTTIDALRREAWAVIVDRVELRRVLSTKAWERLQKTLRDEELPEITEENVEAFRKAQIASIETQWHEAVREVFDFLRPREYGGHKTNHVERVGEKVVLTGWVRAGWYGGCQLHHYHEPQAQALERVLAGLDGNGHVAREHYSELYRVMRESRLWSGETTYYAWKAHKNGNLHLRFKRPDLVRKLNAMAGGARLAGGKAA